MITTAIIRRSNRLLLASLRIGCIVSLLNPIVLFFPPLVYLTLYALFSEDIIDHCAKIDEETARQKAHRMKYCPLSNYRHPLK